MLEGRIREFVSGSGEWLNLPPLSVWKRSFSFYSRSCVLSGTQFSKISELTQ